MKVSTLRPEQKLKSWSGEWFALGSRGIHPSTAAMMERLGLAEKRPCPYGLAVSREYDWRLTERGKIERDRNDAFRHNVKVDLPPKEGGDSTSDVIGG